MGLFKTWLINCPSLLPSINILLYCPACLPFLYFRPGQPSPRWPSPCQLPSNSIIMLANVLNSIWVTSQVYKIIKRSLTINTALYYTVIHRSRTISTALYYTVIHSSRTISTALYYTVIHSSLTINTALHRNGICISGTKLISCYQHERY